MNDTSHNPERQERPKSLWEVMGQSAAETPAGNESGSRQPTNAHQSQEPTEKPIRLKSLWELMRNHPPQSTIEEITVDEVTKETVATLLRDEETSALDLIAEQSPVAVESGLRTEPRKSSRTKTRKSSSIEIPEFVSRHRSTPSDYEATSSSKAVWGLIFGFVAIGLSFLAVLPGLGAKLPALIVGFFALFAGFLAVDEIKTARGRLSGSRMATAGIVLGIIGMFLGPALSWTLGQTSFLASGSRLTQRHLESLGEALNGYHDAQGHFPSGGTFFALPDGTSKPMHGWMTSLLPYLGHENLYRSINLSMAFDDPVNLEPMRKQVPEFQAAEVPQTTSVKGFGAAHFAGIGGETVGTKRRVVHFGIFGGNSQVSRREVRDGLSNTLIAGEIPGAFPAWGEPENWRQIGKGLNREMRGFGNAGGGPTLFLKADGSVRTFSADADPEVLRQLSTRDGEE